MGDRVVVDIPSISTGSLGLDIALGIGGVPQGRVIEIFGPESSENNTYFASDCRMPKGRWDSSFY